MAAPGATGGSGKDIARCDGVRMDRAWQRPGGSAHGSWWQRQGLRPCRAAAAEGTGDRAHSISTWSPALPDKTCSFKLRSCAGWLPPCLPALS